jgi:EAL domain-containing protein (putative c-di-GMP-specific phosphodiesterase class I)
VLHYQPKASLVSGEITGFEALLRWQHPAHGLVPPLQFISVLEDTGLIVSVGEWVVQTVCEQIRKWERQGLLLHPISVNLSARQFQQRDLDDVIGNTLKTTGIDPRLLEFELTESVLMKEAEVAANALQNLKAFGVQISMDDFGTGYSSLAYLKRFPLDVLKIDRAFIRDVTTDPDDATIAIAMINLAHSLGLKVIAEGVETRSQLDFLIKNGCDEMQGYYFSRPLPLEGASRALTEGYRLSLNDRN